MKRFNFFENFPPEIMPEITQFQTLRDRLTIDPLVSKYFNENAKNPLSWAYTGAIDYNNFVQRMHALPINLQQLILSETKPYTLVFAENTARILTLPATGRIQALLTPAQIAAFSHPLTLESLIKLDTLVLALIERLITPDELANAYPPTLQVFFSNKNALTALREDLLTIRQAADMAYPRLIEPLLTHNGIIAMQKGLDVTGYSGSYNNLEQLIVTYLAQQNQLRP